MKKILKGLLFIVILLVPVIIKTDNSWASPTEITAGEIQRRANNLCDTFCGTRFTTDRTSSGSSSTADLLATTWCSNFLGGSVPVSKMPWIGGYSSGKECFAFAQIAQYYLFADYAGEDIVRKDMGSYTFQSVEQAAGTLRIGDAIQYSGHYGIYLGCENGNLITVDSNFGWGTNEVIKSVPGYYYGYDKTNLVQKAIANRIIVGKSIKIHRVNKSITSGGSTPPADTTAPVISNIQITNVTSDGYRVSCTATDNVGMLKVEFPTWSETNGQDDVIYHRGTQSGNTFYYDVKTSEHKNDKNCYYHTHIYAHDTSGNWSMKAAPDTYISSVTYYTFDVNSYLDTYPSVLEGNGLPSGVTCDVYINGSLVANDVNDFVNDYPAGTRYEVKDIKVPEGMHFRKMLKGDLSGTLTGENRIWLFFQTCNNYYYATDIDDKFLKTPATCENPAEYYYVCLWCGHRVDATYTYGEPLGHDEITEKVPATTERDGYIVDKCRRCQKELGRGLICRAHVSIGTKAVYTGKAINKSIRIYTEYGDSISPDNYSITYKNNVKVGTATAKIKFKNDYSGSKTLTFKIVPKAMKINKVVAGSRSLTVKWKQPSTPFTGYQIQFDRTSDFGLNPTLITVKPKTTLSRKIGKLKSGKKYYVRMRVYKTVDGKKYYSLWSETFKVKVK